MNQYLTPDLVNFALRCVVVAVIGWFFLLVWPSDANETDVSADEQRSGSTWCLRDGEHSSKGAIVDHGNVRMECVVDVNDPYGRLRWRTF